MKWTMAISTLHASDGGPSHAVLAVARELATAGEDVTIVTGGLTDAPLDRAYADAEKAGVRIVFVFAKRLTRLRFSIRYLWRLLRESRDSDIITSHGFYQFTSVAAYWSSWINGARLFVQPHGVFEPYQEAKGSRLKPVFMRIVGRRVLTRAEVLLAASNQELSGIRRSLGLRLAEKTRVVGLGVSHPYVEVDRAFHGRRVLFLSRIAPKKRLDKLLIASRLLAEQGKPVHLTICGDGERPYVDSLKGLGDASTITWAGHVSGADRQRIEDEQDLFCLPSDNENFGQAVTEAMSVGLPVVTTKDTGASEHVIAAKCGRVLASPTPEELADVLDALLSAPDQLQEFSANAIDYVSKNLSWPAVAERWRMLVPDASECVH